MILFNNLFILFQSIGIVSLETIKFYFGFIKKEECIINIVSSLSDINIMYTKVLQWVINDTIYNNKNTLDIFEKFTNNVKFNQSEIDYETLIKLNDYNVILESDKPINSGTLSLVFMEKRFENRYLLFASKGKTSGSTIYSGARKGRKR